MDRPPPGPADGRDRPPGPTGPAGNRDSGTFPDTGTADPDPAPRRPELYRPHHDATPVPDDTFPTEPIPVLRLPGWDSGNATYEGSWSDWVARTNTDTADIRPGEEPETVRSPVADPRPAALAAEDGHDPGPRPADSSPASARERLRRRLSPPEPAAAQPVRAEVPAGGRKRALPVLLGVAGVAALGAAAYVQFVIVGGEETPAPAAAAPSATVPAGSGTDPHCAAERVGNTVQGNGPGGTESGPEAIFGFQHAYYVARSGEQARALVAADAAVPPAADIQRGIDSIPAGTTYCVRIDPGAFVGQYTVTITEFRPGTAPLLYNPQLVTAMRIGDRTLITGIGPMP